MKFSIRRFNEWLILVMVVILVPMAFTMVQDSWDFLPDNVNYLFNIHPTIVIIGLATVDAINIFGGGAAEGFSINWRTASIYFNVVLYLMIGPYLFYRGFKRSKSDPDRAKPWYWYIGGATCIWAFMIIPVEINHIRVFNNNDMMSGKNREKDMMRSELAEVGFAAAEYGILKGDINESFKIEDLNLNDLKYNHAIDSIVSDTLMFITVSNPDQPDYSLTMEVKPFSEGVLSIRN